MTAFLKSLVLKNELEKTVPLIRYHIRKPTKLFTRSLINTSIPTNGEITSDRQFTSHFISKISPEYFSVSQLVTEPADDSELNEVNSLLNAPLLPKTITSDRGGYELSAANLDRVAEEAKVFVTKTQNINSDYEPTAANLDRLAKDAKAVVNKVQDPDCGYDPSAANLDRVAKEAKIAVKRDQDLNSDHGYLTLYQIISKFQELGHFYAELDPLGVNEVRRTDLSGSYSALFLINLEDIKKNEQLMNTEYELPNITYIGGDKNKMKLKDIIQNLENIYCNHIGVEFMHSQYFYNSDVKYFREKFETPGEKVTIDEKKRAFNYILEATKFESFLAKKWPSEKRFGLEGCESFIAALGQILDTSSTCGVKTFIIGMAHRGRLNVLANICRKPLYQLFTTFQEDASVDHESGDVKYHLGSSTEYTNEVSKQPIRVTVMANPSHLEATTSVTLGKAKARMVHNDDDTGDSVLPILVHGDASICGQGVCYETLQLSHLKNFSTHGTIHVIINNQLGFTTNPDLHRSGVYCSDIGLILGCPILHVNADDPIAVVQCAKIAAEYRLKSRRDILIDIIGYRRRGHNEGDEPMFTQPLLYQRINKHTPVFDIFSRQVKAENILDDTAIQELIDAFEAKLEAEYQRCLSEKYQVKHWRDSDWSKLELKQLKRTGLPRSEIEEIGMKFATGPQDPQFGVHRSVLDILDARKIMQEKQCFDWAMAEAYAFGSLLRDGHHVRLSGQDILTGEFIKRHHVMFDQNQTNATFNPLSEMFEKQSKYTITNTPVSLFGVLGFELGYSMADPNSLSIYEFESGDFADCAQVIFDQYLCSGEEKWERQAGLVVLLPHGMECTGANSAHPERLLSLCNKDPQDFPPLDDKDFSYKQLKESNWIIVNCTTPANYFHVLRRQMQFPFRKPLLILTPKSMMSWIRSDCDHISEDTEFQRVFSEDGEACMNPGNVKRLVFCTGKVYHDIVRQRDKHKLTGKIAVSRIEQLFPFPYDLVNAEIEKYSNVKSIAWVQEEHKNFGYWSYVRPRLACLNVKNLKYIGRPTSSVTGSSYKQIYDTEFYHFICMVTEGQA